MAKIHFTALNADDTVFYYQYPELMYASSQSAKGFELHDPDGNYQNYIIVHGTGLKYKQGYLVGGTVTGVEFKDGDDRDYVTITNAHSKVDVEWDLSAFSPMNLFGWASKGNDKVTGSKANDVLHGSFGRNELSGLAGDDTLIAEGRDTMTGGRGSDEFCFFGLGKAMITDFDPMGGGTDQDYLYIVSSLGTPRIYQSHHDTVLDFGSGLTLTLVGMDRSDFSVADDTVSSIF